MAQTKTSGSRKQSSSSRSRSGSNNKRGSTKRGGAKRTNSRSRSSSSRASSSRSSRPRSSGNSRATSRSSSSGRAASNGGKGGSTLGTIAKKAKVPAVAGGAALVGLAGGMALNNRHRKRGILDRIPTPKLKKPSLSAPSMPKIKADGALERLGEAAGTVAQRSHQVGDVAAEVQKASDAIKKAR